MAQITKQPDGSLTLVLDPIEQSTYDWLEANEPGKLAAYMTLWLKDRAAEAFTQKFALLSQQDQAELLQKFSQVQPPQKAASASEIPVVKP